ncbi:MAG: hypothetical protein WKF84_03405 [Pyrinomonadaceae bacterium]
MGSIVLRAIKLQSELHDLPLAELQIYSPLIESDIFDALSLDSTLNTKRQLGGTAPERVAEALTSARQLMPKRLISKGN